MLQQAGDWRGADSVWRGIVADLAGQHRRDSLYATILGNLGTAESQLGLLREGEERQRAGVAIWRSIPGDHSLSLVHALNNLGVSLGRQQRWAAAESLHREAYGIARARLGRGHAVTVAALNGLAGALDLQDRLAEADTAYREVLEIRRELLGSEHPEYLFTLFNYAAFLLVQDRCVEAVTHAREVLEHRGTTLAESHPGVASSRQTVGRCLDRLPGGDRDEAGRALLESLQLRRKYLPRRTGWFASPKASTASISASSDGSGRPSHSSSVRTGGWSTNSAPMRRAHARPRPDWPRYVSKPRWRGVRWGASCGRDRRRGGSAPSRESCPALWPRPGAGARRASAAPVRRIGAPCSA